MIKQRPNETEEEYEKRKKRVRLVMMGSLGGGTSISAVTAAILYNMDTFNIDVSNLRTIDNAGSEGATSDGVMYGSNHIYLDGATQSVDYPTTSGSDYVYFDVATKAHVKGTAVAGTTNITASHSNFCSLLGGATISAGDITALNANPEDITRIVKGITPIGTYSFGLANIQAFYPGNEGIDSINYVQDVNTSLGSDSTPNGGFEIDITGGWVTGSPEIVLSHDTTVTHNGSSGSLKVTATATSSLNYWVETPFYSSSLLPANTVHIMRYWVYFETFTTAVAPALYLALQGDTTITHLKLPNPALVGVWQEYVGILKVGTDTSWHHVIRPVANTLLQNGDVFYIDDFTTEELVSFSTITNYTANCRTNLDITNYGASNFLYTQDATGRLTGMHTAGELKGGTDGRNIDINMTIPYNHIVTKDIDKIEGSLTSCTITYSDTTTLVVP